MQDEVFPLNLVLKCVLSSEIPIWSTDPDHTKLGHSEPDHVTTIHKLKTIKRVMNSDWLDHRQHENSVNMYIKFLGPLTPYVDKIVKFHGFK